jgi:hypothetical protein
VGDFSRFIVSFHAGRIHKVWNIAYCLFDGLDCKENAKIVEVLLAVSRDELRPYLTGVPMLFG